MMSVYSSKLSAPSSDRRATPTRVTQDANSTLTNRKRHARVGWNINEHVCSVDTMSRAKPCLTRNHAVFGLFGVFMAALISLCCWSHSQFTTRRLAAEKFECTTITTQPIYRNELACYRRRLTEYDNLPTEIRVNGGKKTEKINGKYILQTSELPKWFTPGVKAKTNSPPKCTDCDGKGKYGKKTPQGKR